MRKSCFAAEVEVYENLPLAHASDEPNLSGTIWFDPKTVAPSVVTFCDDGVCADLRIIANDDSTKYLCPGAYQHFMADFRNIIDVAAIYCANGNLIHYDAVVTNNGL